MRRMFANAMFAGAVLAAPMLALAQTTAQTPPPVHLPSPAKATAGQAETAAVPVWQGSDGTSLMLDAFGTGATATAPVDGASSPLDTSTRSTRAGLRFTTPPGLFARAGVGEISWFSNAANCAIGAPNSTSGACFMVSPQSDAQRGEIGAGFAGNGIKLDLSVGHSQTQSSASALTRRLSGAAALPRVLPGAAGADIATPLWFRDSTATSINARGEVQLAPGTRLDLGASRGRVHFLPGSDLGVDGDLDQTTLSLGLAHGAVSGTIVGHVLEPALPGASLYPDQRWSGIDLGISVRLPWRGELNFGAQNVWTSGRSPLLIGPSETVKDQGRVPYVQYHQDL